MKVKCCRGVCIGVNQHLKPGDFADLDAAQVPFLVSIGAVELVEDAPAVPPVLTAAPEPDPQPRKKEK